MGEVRGAGPDVGIEIVADKVTRAPFDAGRAIPAKVQDAAFAEGLVSRALGSAIAIAPPLIVSDAQSTQLPANSGRPRPRGRQPWHHVTLGLTRRPP